MTESAPGPLLAALGNTPVAPRNPAADRVDEFDDYPRDQWDRPLIAVLDEYGKPMPNPISGQVDRHGTPIPWRSTAHIRASTAGSALEHEGGINSWKIRQAVIGFMSRPDLFSLAKTIEAPGADGRSELDKRIKEAQDAAGSGAAANEGTAMHAFAEKLDRGVTLPALDEATTGWLRAYAELTAGWAWQFIEARLVCSALRMAGRTDRIGHPAGYMIAPDGQIIGPDDKVVVDLKTSSSSKYFGVKFAVQLAVYGHGDLYDPATGTFTPTGARRDWALVLHIPSGATSGAWWWVNIGEGFALAELANEVLSARKSKVVAQVGQVYASLDEALAAGGVLLDEHFVPGQGRVVNDPAPAAEDVSRAPLIAGPADRLAALGQVADQAIADASCEIHGAHGGTVDCIDCLEEWRAAQLQASGGLPGAIVTTFDEWRPVRLELHRQGLSDVSDPVVAELQAGNPSIGAPVADEAVRVVLAAGDGPIELVPGGSAANGTTVPTSVTAAIPADLGPSLQAGARADRDPAAQYARELEAVRTAPPRGGLEAVRTRYASSWTAQHEAHAERRGWELGVLAALERQQHVAGLLSVHAQVAAYPGAWTEEMDRVAERCAVEMAKGDG